MKFEKFLRTLISNNICERLFHITWTGIGNPPSIFGHQCYLPAGVLQPLPLSWVHLLSLCVHHIGLATTLLASFLDDVTELPEPFAVAVTTGHLNWCLQHHLLFLRHATTDSETKRKQTRHVAQAKTCNFTENSTSPWVFFMTSYCAKHLKWLPNLVLTEDLWRCFV